MKKHKTLHAVLTLVLAMLAFAGAALAANRVMVLSEKNETRDVATFDVGLPAHIEVLGGLPVTNTVIVYRISGAGAYTNTLATVTTGSGGAADSAILATNTSYVLRGDQVYFGGVSTSATVRLILTD